MRCSFRPQLDPRSLRRFAHVRSRYAKSPKLMESIRQDQERRAEYLLERRRELEEERNADCAHENGCKTMRNASERVEMTCFRLKTIRV